MKDRSTKFICGTDLSSHSRRSVAAADALARRFRAKLDVVHVMHRSLADTMAKAVREMHEEECRLGLTELAATLGGDEQRVKTHLVFGHADEELVKLGAREDAGLLVVGSVGHRQDVGWGLGSCAERVAESSHTPTLIVRDETAFVDWGKDDRVLRIMVAWDFDETGENALRTAAKWAEDGPCEITVTHVDFPPEEARRLGERTDFFSTHNSPGVQRALERDVHERATKVLGREPDAVLVEGDYSRPDFHFAHLVNEKRPDLVICGTHQFHGLKRLRHNSFSRGLLHNCDSNMLLVPLVHSAAKSAPRTRRVLVATDFSDLGNRAVPMAFAQVADGGTVHLVHVVDPFHVPSPMVPKYQTHGASAKEHDQEACEFRRQLRELVPPEAEARGITVDARVVEGEPLAATICKLAERFDADLICLGSHGRGGLSRLVMGSVTNAVIAHTHRPVLIVKAPVK